MNTPAFPERLRLVAAPGSALESGLSAARTRGPNDVQLRALEASLAASLGALAMGAAAGGAAAAAPAALQAAPTLVSATPGLLSIGALKITAAAVMTFAATTSGLAVYRHARRDAPAAITTARAPRSPHADLTPIVPLPVPLAAAAPPEVAPGAPAAEAPVAGAEHTLSPPSFPHARPRAAAPDGLVLIARAQKLLARDPAQALALVEQNRRAVEESAFAQEGEVITVAALARLGRTAEARDRAARFVERFPDSVHAPRMRRVAVALP